ncbi:hypothetical protein [Mesorhizobium sp.]|uniref:hypothetical protein n=1 Tax=Mesorhizobium sp. TaxID=1871066 RepID=UPI000FE515F8|nr:hypothetical protein [Mesorhizobium sp.]RWI66744.1 MAG: hypothetical protein EOR19_31535 [Mesorhizobium sp.]TIN16153.1 MAG: hypothetical protein E5Y51_15500 [Mesorhizobium sp.]
MSAFSDAEAAEARIERLFAREFRGTWRAQGRQLNREHIPVARGTVQRLMAGFASGCHPGKPVRTDAGQSDVRS